MIIYFYDKRTGEYKEQSTAGIDTEKSKLAKKVIYNIPENATTKKPPKCKQGQCCVFINECWEIVDDYRGKRFFDTQKLSTTTITKLGELPKNYVELNSSEYKAHLRKIDPNTIRNSIKDKIQELYEAELHQEQFIYGYYFKLSQMDEFKMINETLGTQKMKLRIKIAELKKLADKESNAEIKNKLKKEQLVIYQEIDSIKVEISVKNKRGENTKLMCTYDEFNEIHTILQNKKEKLENEKMRATTKLSQTPDSELVMFEQKLRRRGLADNGTTRNETIAKKHIKTS